MSRLLSVFYIALVALFCVSCSKKNETFSRPPPFVEVAKAQTKNIPYYIDAIGQAEAYYTVNLIPQVTGVLTNSHFKSGQLVKKGDLLLNIDDRPFIESLKQAQGQLEQYRATLQYNKEVVKSYAGLLKQDFVSKLDYEQYVSNATIAENQVAQYEAAVSNAQINLNYTKLFAPFDGVIGYQLIDNGNLVTANQSIIAVINQVKPIKVLFAVPEKFFNRVQDYYHQKPLEIQATVPGTNQSYLGQMIFIDNTINTQTGTFLVRGQFSNDNLALWPGQYLDVHLILYNIPDAVLIPTQAVKLDTKGSYVFVVDESMVAQKRSVTLGQIHDNLIVVASGIKAGETVVTEGQLAVVPGSKVQIKTAASQ